MRGEKRKMKEEVKGVVETKILSIYTVLLYVVSLQIYIIDSVVEAVEGKLHLLGEGGYLLVFHFCL